MRDCDYELYELQVRLMKKLNIYTATQIHSIQQTHVYGIFNLPGFSIEQNISRFNIKWLKEITVSNVKF